jgi:hypothetical protein
VALALGWVLRSIIHREGPRGVFEPAGMRRDAASVIFNLPSYRVVDAVDLPWAGAGKGAAD